jgi:hypothetical protein
LSKRKEYRKQLEGHRQALEEHLLANIRRQIEKLERRLLKAEAAHETLEQLIEAEPDEDE